LVHELHGEGGEVALYDSGFHINPAHPYISETPDALINCTCCGEGVLEIKCPYCRKDQSIMQSATEKPFCLGTDESGLVHLKKDHLYYYQVQAQMFVTNRLFCHFIVWTPSELFGERIERDDAFMAEKILNVTTFFKKCILPEILCEYFTKKQQQMKGAASNVEKDGLFCYCNAVKTGNILICASEECKVKKFHQSCVGLKNKPRKQWYCCECRTISKRKTTN
jgi:hypothetical protein